MVELQITLIDYYYYSYEKYTEYQLNGNGMFYLLIMWNL